jgi:hypothetical protein
MLLVIVVEQWKHLSVLHAKILLVEAIISWFKQVDMQVNLMGLQDLHGILKVSMHKF